jgi:hypothetical protein
MLRVIILVLITLAIIFFQYKKEKNIKKSLIATALFAYLLISGYSGYILMKAVPPLAFIHLISIVAGYFAIFYYLFRNKLYIYIFIAPLIIIAIYFGLNHLEGSRYEK